MQAREGGLARLRGSVGAALCPGHTSAKLLFRRWGSRASLATDRETEARSRQGAKSRACSLPEKGRF